MGNGVVVFMFIVVLELAVLGAAAQPVSWDWEINTLTPSPTCFRGQAAGGVNSTDAMAEFSTLCWGVLAGIHRPPRQFCAKRPGSSGS